jgi:hypothetical protein
MFESVGQEFRGDHLDLSFRDTTNWPRVGPDEGLPPSLFMSLGDPVSGPDIQLAIFSPPPNDMYLDTHYHGSDQFRAVIQGEIHVQRKYLMASQFGYQISGVPYREGFRAGKGEDLWMFAVHGERRGARSTMLGTDGDFQSIAFGDDQLDRPVASKDDPYWDDVPGGSKGIIGLGTTLGRQVGGFVWGSYGEDKGWRPLIPGVSITAGVLSDRISGPVILTLRSEMGRPAVPRATYGTEVAFSVIRGSCQIGDRKYIAGEVRIQKAGTTMDAIVSGPDGLDAVLMIADRRMLPQTEASDPLAERWPALIAALIAELTPP